MSERPAISVIVPFAGSQFELERLLVQLHGLRLGPADEVIVADNRSGARPRTGLGQVRAVAASGIQSAGFARNRAAAAAVGEWLVFLDAAALVHHAVQRLGVLGTLRQATRWSACVRLFAEHPGARVMLHRRWFCNVWHYLLLRSVLALLGPPWLRRMVVGRHVLALRARGRVGGAGAWSVPFLALHDLLETAAVVRGAARYRTPLL